MDEIANVKEKYLQPFNCVQTNELKLIWNKITYKPCFYKYYSWILFGIRLASRVVIALNQIT